MAARRTGETRRVAPKRGRGNPPVANEPVEFVHRSYSAWLLDEQLPARLTSTEARSAFGRMLKLIRRDGAVIITRRGVPEAVMISMDECQRIAPGLSLEREPNGDLDLLAAEFDALMAKMQAPEAEAAYRAAFGVSAAELDTAVALKFARTNL
jgi:prevent-host-death family protein